MRLFSEVTEFTDNETIDSIEVGDDSAELFGYVESTIAKKVAFNGAYVKRLIVSNGQGRQVQLIAWGDDTFILEKYDVNQVIMIERVRSRVVQPSSRFNGGNVPFELVVTKNSNLNFMGELEDKKENPPGPANVTFDNILNVKGSVYIGGHVKNNFRELRMKEKTITFGSITDGLEKLEIHVLKNSEHDIQKGSFVGVTGHLKLRDNAPPFLQVPDMKAVELDDTKKESLTFLLDGYKYVQ